MTECANNKPCQCVATVLSSLLIKAFLYLWLVSSVGRSGESSSHTSASLPCALFHPTYFFLKWLIHDFGVDHLVMSMCRVFSCVVGRGCLLWPVHFLGKTLLVFALLHSIFQGQICLLPQVFLDFYFCIPVPYNEKDLFFGCSKGLVGLHRTIQLQLLQHYWLGHRLWLLWYWMDWLGNEQRSFCHFWDCIQVLHLRLFCWPWWLLHFF